MMQFITNPPNLTAAWLVLATAATIVCGTGLAAVAWFTREKPAPRFYSKPRHRR